MPHLHLNPPFRAEHVGSLLRPAKLLAKRTDFEAGKCSAEELKAVEDESIPAIVRLQQEAGIKTITDGEMRRGAFYQGMFENLDGMTIIPNRSLDTFKAYIPYVALFHAMGIPGYPSIYCTGKIKRTKGIHTEDFKFLSSLVAPEDVKTLKVTVCGPTWMHLRHGSDFTYDTSVYKNDAEYFADLIRAYREEIDELYSLGCRNIQFDDPTFCFFCAESMIAGMEQAGVDHEALLDTYITLYNSIIDDRGYGRIAEKLFKDLSVDCFYLEYDNDRAGNFEPFDTYLLIKFAILGIITTKSGTVGVIYTVMHAKLTTSVARRASVIKERVLEAAKIISKGDPERSVSAALNQICLSPQCGFASVFEGNPITEEAHYFQARSVAHHTALSLPGSVVRAANAVEKSKPSRSRKKGSSHADVIDRLDFSGVGPRNIPSSYESPYPSPAIYAPYEPPKKKHDAIAEAWGIHEPEPFEDFSAGGGYSARASGEYGASARSNGNGTMRRAKDGRDPRDVYREYLEDAPPPSREGRRQQTKRTIPPPQPIFVPDGDVDVPEMSPTSGGPSSPRRNKSIMHRIRKMRDSPNVPRPIPPSSAENSGVTHATALPRPTHRSQASFLGRFGRAANTGEVSPSDPAKGGTPSEENAAGYFEGSPGGAGLGRRASLLKKVKGVVKGGAAK
ncbi:Uncharacterized protein YxjH [Grifola frondosa]|uniref:Uncharacterized protein YxjH n=1 Tax=Grifola frondosa TaxID=5627 RepID=A0A1C7MRB5_GRIFR|nr:Uncharacterized protein YxjH [Grifola frondosa]